MVFSRDRASRREDWGTKDKERQAITVAMCTQRKTEKGLPSPETRIALSHQGQEKSLILGFVYTLKEKRRLRLTRK